MALRYKSKLFQTWFCAFLVFPVFGQWNKLGLTEGLPSETIYEIAQDNQGSLWIGTERGLVRWDGKKLHVLSLKDGLPEDEILITRKDRKGRIWCLGATGHVFYMENNRISRTYYNKPIPRFRLKSFFSCFYEDRGAKTIYIGTFRDGLIRISPSGIQHLYEKKAPTFHDNNAVRGIIESGNQLLAYSKNKVFTIRKNPLRLENPQALPAEIARKAGDKTVIISGNQLKLYYHRNLLAVSDFVFPQVNSLSIIGYQVYVNTVDGAFLFDLRGHSFHFVKQLLPDHSITSCFKDALGNLLIGTHSSGLFIFPKKRTQKLSALNKEDKPILYTDHRIAVLRNKSLEIPDLLTGVLQVKQTFNTPQEKVLFSGPLSVSLSVEKQAIIEIPGQKPLLFQHEVKDIVACGNSVCLLSIHGIFSVKSSNGKMVISSLFDRFDSKIRHITRVQSGDYWCTDATDLYLLKNKHLTPISSTAFERIFQLKAVPKKNCLVLLTDNGFFLFNTRNRSFKALKPNKYIPYYRIVDFDLTPENHLVFSSANGLSVITDCTGDSHSFIRVTDQAVLSFVLEEQAIWFNDGNSLRLFDLGDFLRIEPPAGKISSIRINEEPVSDPGHIRLSSGDQLNVRVTVPSINPEFPLQLRYRIGESDPLYTSDPQLTLRPEFSGTTSLVIEGTVNGHNWNTIDSLTLKNASFFDHYTWLAFPALLLLVLPVFIKRGKSHRRKTHPLTPEILPENDETDPFLMIKSGSNIVKVYEKDILYIQGAKEYIIVFYQNQRVITLMTMKAFLNQLQNPDAFIQVQKSYIVCKEKVDRVESSRFVCIGTHKIPIGGTYKQRVLEALGLT